MKKVISLMLALAICLSLCACGSGSAGSVPDSTRNLQQPQGSEPAAAPAAQEGADASDLVSLGQEIDMGFAAVSFSSAVLTFTVGGDGFGSSAQNGMRFFSLTGTIRNTGGSPLPVGNVKAEMVFNGTYTYTASATILNSKSYPVSLAPLAQAEYWIYAEIPDSLLELLSDCEVRFSLNDSFASVPDSAENGDYAYRVPLDEDTCSAALEGTGKTLECFDECPALPTPVNDFPVYRTSFSSSSHNGKVSSIEYGFSVIPGRSDDLKEIYGAYIAKLEAAGFTIQNDTGSGCDIYSNGTKLASLSADNTGLRFKIEPGSESITADSSENPDQSAAAPSTDAVVHMGDTIETDYLSLTLEKYDSGDEIRSGTGNYGMYSYRTSDNGDPYFYLYGTFKNLGGTPVDIRNIYVQFCFDGKYNYKGSVDGVSGDCDSFINDVSPLSSVNYYMYTAVPRELIDSFSTCTVRIGFTENFDYKVVDVNDLPKFEQCDHVFCLEIEP